MGGGGGGENDPLLSLTKSSEQTKKSRKIASLQLDLSSCILKLPIRIGANHLIFKPEFSVLLMKMVSTPKSDEWTKLKRSFILVPKVTRFNL